MSDIGAGIAIAGVAIAFGLILTGARVEVEGITGHDLRLAVQSCMPSQASFEQELACFQAVYGGQK